MAVSILLCNHLQMNLKKCAYHELLKPVTLSGLGIRGAVLRDNSFGFRAVFLAAVAVFSGFC
jgi:hypothetical protein